MQKTVRRALANASRRINFKTSITRFASAFGTYIVLKLTRRPAFARGRYLLRSTYALVPRT